MALHGGTLAPEQERDKVRRSRLVELLGSGSIENVTQQGTSDNEAKDILIKRRSPAISKLSAFSPKAVSLAANVEIAVIVSGILC